MKNAPKTSHRFNPYVAPTPLFVESAASFKCAHCKQGFPTLESLQAHRCAGVR